VRLASILLARAVNLFETLEMNPQGKAYFPDLVGGLVERFKFQKFPQKPEELDESKGVEFADGHWEGITIEAFKIFNDGLVLETRSSTADSQRILDEGLAWVSSTYGLAYSPTMVRKRLYVSQLVFFSEAPILRSNPALSNLIKRVATAHAEMFGQALFWEPTILTLQAESGGQRVSFSIQRRANTSPSENKYFSEAPLPTDIHMRLLQAFEGDILEAASQR
jgi:hypothetical protein